METSPSEALVSGPAASPQVVAAIVAAVDAVWPTTAVPGREDGIGRSRSSWRFSGRWWSRRRVTTVKTVPPVPGAGARRPW